MASRLHDHINSFTLERGIEFDQAYTLTPTRTGSNSAGTFSLAGVTPTYESTVGPLGGSGSWKFYSPRTGTGSNGATNFRVASGANTTDLATFSDNDWSIGLWFKLNNKITSQYSSENEIDILSCGGFRIAYSSSIYGGGATGNRFMISTNGSGYSTWQATGHTAVEANRWYYLAVRNVSGTWSVYLDGTLVRTISGVGAITPSDLRFGSGNTTGASSSADMTWNISNFHYGTSASLTEGAIQSIWGVGSRSQAWTTAINSESPSPFVWVKFDQATGNPTTISSSGSKTFNDQNGTRVGPASGATIANDGKSNQHITFVGDNASTGRTSFLFASTSTYNLEMDDGKWSVEWWAKVPYTYGSKDPTAFSIYGNSGRHISAIYHGAGMAYPGKLNFVINGSTNTGIQSSTTTPTDNNWHHYVVVWDNATSPQLKLYIDGQLDNSVTTSDFGTIESHTIRIGGIHNSLNANWFNGAFDEFIIWEQALTSTDVSDHYNSTLPPAVNINYTNTTGATASATSPDAAISLPRNYNSDPLTASADIVMPAFDISTPVTVNADVTTASADSVMPAINLDTNADAFGVGTASAELVHPTLDLVSNIDYSHSVATADATSPNAVVTITKAVSYSASPATSSALLGGNVYAGPTVQDIHYDLTIRQIGNTTNTNGTGGFTLGSTWDSNTKLDMNSLAIKPVSGIPSNGSLIKVRIAGSPDITITNQDVNGDNEYNIYVFTADPSTTFDTMTGANLPAKELLYKTRANDNDAQRLDLTPAFKDSRGQTYGIYIEHVGTPPYSGTVWDRVSYSGSNLNTKALYILTSEFTNVNYNAPVATATGTQTDVSVYVERYINVSESPATASGLVVHPTIITERTVNVAAMETTASAQAVQPAFSGGATYTSDHLEAFAEGLAFVISTTRNVNIAVDPSTLSALLHMPQAQIGENNSVDHMNASATFPMPTLLFERNIQPAQLTATALMRDPVITTQQRGTIKADPMTARTFIIEPPAYFKFTNDKWFTRMNAFQNTQPGHPNVPVLKFFTMPTDIVPATIRPGNTAFVSSWSAGQSVPVGNIVNDRAYSLQTSSTQSFPLFWNSGPGNIEVGYFDNQNRKAVRFKNTSLNGMGMRTTGTGGYQNPNNWSIDMMFKAEKKNQVIFNAGPLSASAFSNNNRTFNMGLYNGKWFFSHTTSGPGGASADPAYRAYPWDPIYGVGSTRPEAYNLVGNKDIADGKWHHIVIQAIAGRAQVFIDGELDIQRYNVPMVYPFTVGWGGWSEDADCDFYLSALSISPDAYLSDREIDLNNAYANGYAVYEATPATATLTMQQNVKGRGNRPRALALYWWPRYRGGQVSRQEDFWDSQRSGAPEVEFDYPTFFTNIDTYEPKSQKFFGWDIYSVDVTGTYYSEVVKRESYSGEIRTVTPGFGQPYTISDRGFRDSITDNRRLIDLVNDIDLEQVEAIFFINYPNETRELDNYIRDEFVDEFFNIREKDIYQEFLKGLRGAVDKGINLMVSNSQLALDLGIVDRVEIIDPLIDGITYVRSGGTGVFGDFQAPGYVVSAEDAQNDVDRAIDLVPGASGKATEKDGKWIDFSFNNRLRIINTIPGITDLMYFTLDDIAYFAPNGQYRYGAPPELYTRMVYRPNGATPGTEFIMPDAANSGASGGYADLYRRYLAVPFENVKAGKIVAAFGQTYKRKNQVVENPYKNYATHIALERGTVLQGKPLGGRIWVTITERPQNSTGSYNEVELSSDYWIDLAFNLGIITAAERTAYKARPQNIDRQLERGELTQAQYNKIKYWSELGYNQTTSVSSATSSLAQQAVTSLGKLFEQIFTQNQKQSAEEAGISSFFNYSGTGIIAMVQNFYTEPKAALPTVSLNGAAFGWLANKEQVPGTQVRDIAGTANVIMIDPVIVADKLVAVNAQAMLATGDVKDPTNFIWTQKDNNYVSLPMLASALINPKLTLVRADAMTAAAVFKDNIGAIVTQVDEVILYINHVDPVLYLREDIVK